MSLFNKKILTTTRFGLLSRKDNRHIYNKRYTIYKGHSIYNLSDSHTHTALNYDNSGSHPNFHNHTASNYDRSGSHPHSHTHTASKYNNYNNFENRPSSHNYTRAHNQTRNNKRQSQIKNRDQKQSWMQKTDRNQTKSQIQIHSQSQNQNRIQTQNPTRTPYSIQINNTEIIPNKLKPNMLLGLQGNAYKSLSTQKSWINFCAQQINHSVKKWHSYKKSSLNQKSFASLYNKKTSARNQEPQTPITYWSKNKLFATDYRPIAQSIRFRVARTLIWISIFSTIFFSLPFIVGEIGIQSRQNFNSHNLQNENTNLNNPEQHRWLSFLGLSNNLTNHSNLSDQNKSNNNNSTDRNQDNNTHQEPEKILSQEKQFSIYVPKIDLSALVIANVDADNTEEYTKALKQGVAHAKGSGFPGLDSNFNKTIYLFSHSTSSPWLITTYNAHFYNLRNLEVDDIIEITFWGKNYRYKMKEKKILEANELSDLEPQTQKDQLILQTCWPPGTTDKRLLVIAEPEL